MPGGTTGNDDETLGIQQLLFIVNNSGEDDIVCVHIDTSTHTVCQTLWLLEDLF